MIGRTNVGGGGGGLNFEVKAYASEDILPATAKENTIAVITDTPITAYTFSATEPTEPIEGMVWITVDVASTVEFNALKKNSIQVYPISAKQYIGGAGVDVEAKSFQNGVWVNWWNGELYTPGNEWISVTGGWVTRKPDGYFNSIGTITKSDQTLKLVANSRQYVAAGPNAKIDLSGFKTLCFNVPSKSTGSGRYAFMGVFSDSFMDTEMIAKIDASTIAVGLNYVDISAISGQYYVGFGCAADSGTSDIEVSEVNLK